MISMASSERSLTPDQRSPSENHDAPLGTFCLLFCNVFHFVTAFFPDLCFVFFFISLRTFRHIHKIRLL